MERGVKVLSLQSVDVVIEVKQKASTLVVGDSSATTTTGEAQRVLRWLCDQDLKLAGCVRSAHAQTYARWLARTAHPTERTGRH